MGDPNNLSQFKYAAMSNLVLQADKRFITRRGDENTGDPESLAGRINVRNMGERVAHEVANDRKRGKAPGIERGNIADGAAILEREQRKRKRDGPVTAGISLADLDVDDLRYRPRTVATRATYDLIITIVARNLGDVPAQITVSAADAILETLKNEDMKDFDKKREIDDVLGISLGSKEFNEFVNLGKKITDYDNQENEDDVNGLGFVAGAELDDRQGVAVDFDEDEDLDEDGIAQTNEVKDETNLSDDEDSGEDEEHGVPEATTARYEADQSEPTGNINVEEDEEMVLEPSSTNEALSSRGSRHDISVPTHEIDAFWLQRQIGHVFTDAHSQQEKTQDAFNILSAPDEAGEERLLRDIENDLMELFDYEHHRIVTKLVSNRDKIVWITKWRQAADNDAARLNVENEMNNRGHQKLLEELRSKERSANEPSRDNASSVRMDLDPSTSSGSFDKQMSTVEDIHKQPLQPRQLIKLENLVFDQGNHLMTNPNVKLPPGSVKKKFKGYEEIHVPIPKVRKEEGEVKNMSASSLPDWARAGFGSSKELNRIQTRCFPTAFQDDGNMLVCAPTGSGKTNVAMLAMLREIGKHRNSETGEINLSAFKIVYIAPLKALVQEQVGNFGLRLKAYGIRVAELTGDRQLTKQQIAETQVIVTTPEKWDVITRKATDLSYTSLVRLICIDEIHLLHDERGPVLESIVSRTIRKMDQTGEHVRIVGLSATLPNYEDVAHFLRADPVKGVFHFDGSFRPCPLRQEFIGVTDKKPIKQLKTMNDVCYTKVMEQVGQNRNQMLIFVHSRKETAKTAKYIRDKALEMETIAQILRSDAASREILTTEAAETTNQDLKDLLPYGFGIHHAGMRREDRTSVEDLFAEGAIQVLVCTATLAWGVNLPAHSVIIKGTQIYSPEKGRWVELSPQDVLQMLGRAGRPQYDTFGEGIIITTYSEIQYYLSLLNQQLPIESQFIGKMADCLNAEVVLGNVRSRSEGVEWLGYTYLFVRMLRTPGLYGVGAESADDVALEQKRVDLIHSAASALQQCGLIKYEKKSGKMQATELGRIASHYYITHNSMLRYSQHLHPSISQIEMFRIFAQSEEFTYIPVRQDEKLELAKLLARVPVPVKESIEEPHAKVNVLLQAYISRLKLEGLALMADLVYVTQSAGRILRAIFEICLRKGWASVAKMALDLCKMAEKRMWPTMTPLRQFPERAAAGEPAISREIVQKAERVDVPWQNYFDLDPLRMGELIGIPKAGRTVCYAVQHFPRLTVNAHVQPITRSMLRLEIVLTPNFDWSDQLHGAAELFWILVEDCDGEEILFYDQFVLRKAYAQADASEHIIEVAVPIAEPMPPNYFVTVLSDRWMHSEMKLPVSFHNLVLPEKFPPHTPLLELQPLPVSALKRSEYQDLYKGWNKFNKIQTQSFNSLFTTDDNVFLAAPTGSGKSVCAEFALLRLWSKSDPDRAVYLAPFQELIDIRFNNWQTRFAGISGGKQVSKLTGDTSTDLKLLERADLVLATPSQWDVISRQWQRRKNVQSIKLFIADDIHMIGGLAGHVYETVVSRMHTIAIQLNSGLRIVGLSVSLSNARDVGEWIGASKHNILNFSPQNRPMSLELLVQSFNIPHFPSLMLAMAKPVYLNILQLSPDKPAIVFVPGRKQVRQAALDLLGVCLADSQGEGQEDRFLHASIEQLAPVLSRIHERALAESISHGIGYFHEALSAFDKKAVQHLYQRGIIQIVLVSRDCCWEFDSNAHLVIVMGTQFFEGKEHRYLDYPISEILQMFGRAGRIGEDKSGKGVLMVPSVKREYYKKFLNEALPVESQLQHYLHDALVTEISTKLVGSTQDALDWTTYTYFYRRLLANPSFYGLTGISHELLSAHLSDLVEGTVKELADAKIIEHDEEDDTISALNPAMIASYYNISFTTIQTFLLSLSGRTRMKGLLEIVTSAAEFEAIHIRRHEDLVLRQIYDRLQIKMPDPNYESPHFKVFVLLQAHFSRMQLPIDLRKDQEFILKRTLNLLSACVDVLSSEGHLNATLAMEMSQMVVQAQWDQESPLKQLPHFDDDMVERAKTAGIKDIFEFMAAMDPSENKDYHNLIQSLGLNNKQLVDIARFTNDKYPNIEMTFDVDNPQDITAGSPSYLKVNLERDFEGEDIDEDTSVEAPHFPADKSEVWWLVVGEESTKSLLAIKRISIGRKLQVKLEFVVPSKGAHQLTLSLVSDSYVGVDQIESFEVDVAEGEEEEEEEEDEEEDEEDGMEE